MKKEDSLLIQSSLTSFEEVEFVRKNALLDWAESQMRIEHGYESGEAECGYKDALMDMVNFIGQERT